MTQYIKKLPAVFQTVTEKKFFDATFDQVFSKKDSDLLAGYLGRRDPGFYNPITDFYLPEPFKNRTWWQLEATAFARTEDTTKSNIFFYEDLLDRINYYGGNTLNQDRLFESEYYSFGPPIDYDMFINYHNYYWVEQGLSTISITGVLGTDIIGKSSYTTPPTATPPNLKLTSGMSISLLDDPDYASPHTIENFGGCVGIGLVPPFPDFTAGTIFEFLPWDGVIELSNGRLISNLYWDATTWDTQTQPGNGDYITIERGCIDRNAWSRTNKWFHIDAITSTIIATNTPFPANATRGLRPIIQFVADLELYKSGTQFRTEIQYGFRDNLFGSPIRRAELQGLLLSDINDDFDINMKDGDLVGFFNDNTPFNFWDMQAWDFPPIDEWDAGFGVINQFIYLVVVALDGTVTFEPYTSWTTPVIDGDIVFITEDGPYNAAQRGQTWYYDNNIWQEAFNDKITTNQPPLFLLRDHNGVMLDDPVTYPQSNFNGSKIFSYKINTESGATVDPVLRFPIVYTSLGQASDIVFENDLITERYVYSNAKLPISGYYYYKTSVNPVLFNNWNLYQPCPCDDIIPPPPNNCLATSKQRVIDKFVVGYGTEFKFKLSVTPYGYPAVADIIVSVNGVEVKSITEQANGYTFEEINNRVYIDLTTYLTTLLSTTQSQPPVVEAQTYTHGLLDPTHPGYFEIPQQLEANPTQLEVSEISGSELIQHFSSIILNQIGATGIAFGGDNNYRDTRKNRSVGTYILQNVSPLLKTMLVSSSDDLDFVAGVRFSQNEYTKFKNKYLSTALQLINHGFNPVQYYNNNISISLWVEEILKIVNVSKEFSNAFAYSYMIANGSPFVNENKVVPLSGLITLTNYVDLADPKNALYIYDTTGQETLLVIGEDYDIVSSNLVIEIQINTANVPVANTLFVALYKNPLPAYIPSTPTKIGSYPTYIPRIELDTSYAIPTNVIIGHDGSKTIAYNDYRDQLLLELEKRIYNLLQNKFRNQHYLPLRLESVKSGYYRQTRYSREEFLDISESYLNKWSAKNRANYRANDWSTSSLTTPVNQLWKLYNYRFAEDANGVPLNLPGNWKGIFQYYYDTYYPDTRPWEMLGFGAEPLWWRFEYGPPVLNMAGQEVWTSIAAGAHSMWSDLEFGIIRQGPCAIYNPVTLLPQEQVMWARPGLSAVIPVDAAGEVISVMTLFNVVFSGNDYAPFDLFDVEWIYGDGSPVEQAWMSTSAYAFNVQEFLYLMRPAPFGELFWDTVGTELSPGMINVPGINGPVRSDENWQFVQNDTFTSSDPFFAWMRLKSKDQIVHAESIDNEIQIRYGYQRWISDRILFLGKDVTSTFGQKIRTLDVNLANKLAGFTNKDTTNTYIEATSPNATTNTLIIPSTNFDVVLHKGPPVDTYSYSGVIIRGLVDGTFAVYGYDLLNSEFTIFDRANEGLIDVTVGGTPAPFEYFTSGETYTQGDIVRYNGVYYLSLVTQTVQKFIAAGWKKLNALPIIGGVSVSYKPFSAQTITRVPYGTVMKTPQEVFDMLIGWGDYLQSRGWKFDEVNTDTNHLNDWLTSGKQFLFWLNSEWAPDSSIQLSPLANKATLTISRGYPNDIESLTNGVYSILDKFGMAISPSATATDRDGRTISVEPNSLAAGGIYFLQINAAETEHVLIFDNLTNFNDVVYSPLLRARQQRLRFNGFRSNGWYGKMEAPGYLVIADQLVPNYDTIVESMRYFYDPNVTIDNPSLEDLGRSLIGYESKSYLDNLQVSNDVQYLFYQGFIRQKGTKQAFEKLFRSTKVQSNEIIEVFEEWALKLGDFGNTIDQVSTEFILKPEQNTGEVIVARLNYIPSTVGFVRQINILNAQNTYTHIPRIIVNLPDADPLDPVVVEPLRQAKAYAVLDSNGRISRIDITDPGYGYLSAPYVEIDSGSEPHNLDKLYSVWQGAVIRDKTLDNILNIDIDRVDQWIVRPNDPQYSLKLPVTPRIEYSTPNAGYVHFNDVDWYSFDKTETAVTWGTEKLNPIAGDTIWIAKTFTEDWDVYKLVDITTQSEFVVFKAESDDILLRTALSCEITTQFSTTGVRTDFGNMIVLQMGGAEATAESKPPTAQATATAVLSGIAVATSTVSGGAVTGFTITNPGVGYVTPPTITIADPSANAATMTSSITNGVVTSITITDGGAGYTIPPPVTIDSPLLENATAISTITAGIVTTVNIVLGGAGYAIAPAITFEPPGDSATATADIANTGQVSIINIGNPGSGYVSPPTVTVDPPIHITATASASIEGSSIDQIIVTNNGSGYRSPPVINITDVGGSGTGATATAIVNNGVVSGIEVINGGSGYGFGTIVISISAPTGAAATAVAIISDGKVTDIDIINPGSGYSTLPDVSITPPSGVTATGTAIVSNGQVTGISLVNPGSGYAFPPSITIGLPSGVAATATAVISGGAVTGAIISTGGSGYISAPIITVGPAAGSTTATATASILNGELAGITVVNPGAGYIAPPAVSISAPDGGNPIESITVDFPGFGYVIPPDVIITGDSFGATATAVLSNGQVTSIIVDNGGSGYTTATVELSAPPDSGTGEIISIEVTKSGAGYTSTPTVVISDIGGYGSGATAVATVLDGLIQTIDVVTPGVGYVNPIVSITPPGTFPGDNYTVGINFAYSDDTYNYYNLVTLGDNPITDADIGNFASFTNLLVYKTMRWRETPVEPLLPVYVGLGDKIWVDDVSGKWTVFNIQAEPGIWDIKGWDLKVIDFWSPNYGWDVTGPMYFNPYRIQEKLINTSFFESAQVFAHVSNNELVRLPVYDPFKDILPGPARQNIAYMSMQDPARYNITGNQRLYSENINFGEQQVGQLWWDLSSTRYVYYEQPIALDGSETAVDNLVYRRDRWGQLFPGSAVAIYEWVKSSVPPDQYTGTGIPRDVNSYVIIVTSNRFTSITETNYYFWVLGTTDKPNIENRTLAALDVTRLLQSPKSQGFVFFSPIQQTSTNNSYMFYNVQEILSYQGDNVQIEYKLSERDDQEHAQWSFFREGDPNSVVTDQFWNKMVDSICGYTKVLPVSDEYGDGIIVARDLPWDIYGWDIALWDTATLTTTAMYGEILPVPDPTLTESEKYGIEYRPRQGMFQKIHAARKVFVQAANSLLKHIQIRDNDPSWNNDVATSVYWEYTNWYEIGYEDAIPTNVYQTLIDANAALLAGKLQKGNIVQVINGTVDGRFILYAVVQLNPNVPILSFEEVGVEKSAIKLLDTVYTSNNQYGLAVELRELLNAFRTKVLINSYKVDQNELFFAMVNYVLSEQKNPNWVFKSSYIYIKENNLPLSQTQLFIPNQIDNIIKYIIDAKPYHTQIRDYTSTYLTSDIATGTATDSYKIKSIITFGPDNLDYGDPGHWDADCDNESLPRPWDNYAWDVCPPDPYILNALTFTDNIEQFVSRENVYTVPLTFFDATKIGYSALYPYTFNFDSINLNNPQTFISPYNIVGIQVGTTVLLYGQDYYVDYNISDDNYTVYFYNDPGNTPVPIALVWFDGGGMQHFRYNTATNEVAHGFAKTNLVVNADTKLPVSNAGGIIGPFDGPWDAAPWETTGTAEIPWDLSPIPEDNILSITHVGNLATLTSTTPHGIPVTPAYWTIVLEVTPSEYNGAYPITVTGPNTFTYLMDSTPATDAITVGTYYLLADETISSKENTNLQDGSRFYRNADSFKGELVVALPAPTVVDENIDVIVVTAAADILPVPGITPGVIWINGERIEYKSKNLVATNTWELRLVRRGTMGTAPTAHLALSYVFVERGNLMPLGANIDVWNAVSLPTSPNLSTITSPGEYTSITSVPVGGLWYAGTPEAVFLKQEQGKSIP